MLEGTQPQENKFTRMLRTFDPDVPGWLFWAVFLVLAGIAVSVIR